MTTPRTHPESPVDPVAVGRRVWDALTGGDLAAFRAVVAPDVVIHSPVLTFSDFAFAGADEAVEAVRMLTDAWTDPVRTHEWGSAGIGSIAFTARLRGRHTEGVFVNHVDESGLVVESTLLIRGLEGVARFARVAGPGLARPHHRGVSALNAVGTAVALVGAHAVDRAGSYLVARAMRRHPVRASAHRTLGP